MFFSGGTRVEIGFVMVTREVEEMRQGGGRMVLWQNNYGLVLNLGELNQQEMLSLWWGTKVLRRWNKWVVGRVNL